jgi:hypothetical protein
LNLELDKNLYLELLETQQVTIKYRLNYRSLVQLTGLEEKQNYRLLTTFNLEYDEFLNLTSEFDNSELALIYFQEDNLPIETSQSLLILNEGLEFKIINKKYYLQIKLSFA